MLHPHHFHRPPHDQILVRTIDVVVHRAYGHGSRAGLLACRNRQQRSGLGEVVRSRRHGRLRRHRHLDVALDNRVQARGHRALTIVFGDAGRGDRECHPGLYLVLQDVPVAVLSESVYACYRRDVEEDRSAGERSVVLVVRGRKRGARAAHIPGGYGKREVAAQRIIVGRRGVVHVCLVNTDPYRHVVGQRPAQGRDDRAGLALVEACRHRQDRQGRFGGIVIDGEDCCEDDSHEAVVRVSKHRDYAVSHICVLDRREGHGARALGLSISDHQDRIGAQFHLVRRLADGHVHVGRQRTPQRTQGDRADLTLRYRRRCRYHSDRYLLVVFQYGQRLIRGV